MNTSKIISTNSKIPHSNNTNNESLGTTKDNVIKYDYIDTTDSGEDTLNPIHERDLTKLKHGNSIKSYNEINQDISIVIPKKTLKFDFICTVKHVFYKIVGDSSKIRFIALFPIACISAVLTIILYPVIAIKNHYKPIYRNPDINFDELKPEGQIMNTQEDVLDDLIKSKRITNKKLSKS